MERSCPSVTVSHMESNAKILDAGSATISLEHIRAADTVVKRTVAPKPLLEYPLLNWEAGARIFIKHEFQKFLCVFCNFVSFVVNPAPFFNY
jgi:hypothetical protein